MADPRAALDAIGQLPDAEIDLADAALQLARVDAPDEDWVAARNHLSRLAQEAAALSVTADDLPAARDALAALIHGDHGYTGDSETYDDLDNANLIRVIARRRGLPVVLGILWLHCARAAGLGAHGLDFPGHFLIALEAADQRLVLDAFAGGQTISQATLIGKSRRPMATRAILLRLQNNILIRRLSAEKLPEALACAEDMLRFAPDHAVLWHDAATLHRRLGHVSAAVRCLGRFIELTPDTIAAAKARAAMDAMRSQLN